MFKERFFPNCSILEAKDSRSGSYAWKSIFKGLDVNLEVLGGRLEMGGL